ncbi:MAG: hypothetical protein WCE81_02125 [Halobacteriota archaeon]
MADMKNDHLSCSDVHFIEHPIDPHAQAVLILSVLQLVVVR